MSKPQTDILREELGDQLGADGQAADRPRGNGDGGESKEVERQGQPVQRRIKLDVLPPDFDRILADESGRDTGGGECDGVKAFHRG